MRSSDILTTDWRWLTIGGEKARLERRRHCGHGDGVCPWQKIVVREETAWNRRRESLRRWCAMLPGIWWEVMVISIGFSLSGLKMELFTIPLKDRRCRCARIWYNTTTSSDPNVSRRNNSSVESLEVVRLLRSYASWCRMRLGGSVGRVSATEVPLDLVRAAIRLSGANCLVFTLFRGFNHVSFDHVLFVPSIRDIHEASRLTSESVRVSKGFLRKSHDRSYR